MNQPVLLGVVTSLCLALSGCAGGFSRESAVESFVAANPDATTTNAECVVDRLIETYELTGLELELAAEPISDQFVNTQFNAMFNCGMTGDVEDALAVQLAEAGSTPFQAECAAAELVGRLSEADLEVLLTGELNDGFYAKYFDSLESCGALP